MCACVCVPTQCVYLKVIIIILCRYNFCDFGLKHAPFVSTNLILQFVCGNGAGQLFQCSVIL